jgi:hypothetical protein
VHILFVHKNFPAQFGHIAGHLIKEKGYRCTFVSEPAAYRHLGAAGERLVREQYSLEAIIPRMTAFYEAAADGRGGP